jgi:hypothetical protein
MAAWAIQEFRLDVSYAPVGRPGPKLQFQLSFCATARVPSSVQIQLLLARVHIPVPIHYAQWQRASHIAAHPAIAWSPTRQDENCLSFCRLPPPRV